jgi:glycosyltransferase involved in cell wall biosynthesis
LAQFAMTEEPKQLQAVQKQLQLSIILPTKDRQPILFKTLRSILRATETISCEIFVIDNSSAPDIILPADLCRENVRILKNPHNRNSVFSSRNYGASLASSELLLFIDDDILVTPESIAFVLEFHRTNERKAANVSWQYPPELLEKMRNSIFGRFLIRSGFTTMRELYGVNRWKDGTVFESGEVASYFFSIPKNIFHEIGGYEGRHLHEGTDVSLIDSLRRNGVKMFINAKILVYHNEEDRVEIRNWLERKKRLGEISAFAVGLGDKSGHEMSYSATKSAVFRLLFSFRSLLLFFIAIAPQRSHFADKFMFRLISGLTGAYIYSGYQSQRSKNTQA